MKSRDLGTEIEDDARDYLRIICATASNANLASIPHRRLSRHTEDVDGERVDDADAIHWHSHYFTREMRAVRNRLFPLRMQKASATYFCWHWQHTRRSMPRDDS